MASSLRTVLVLAVLAALNISGVFCYPDCWPNGGEPTLASMSSVDTLPSTATTQQASTEPVSMTNTYFGDEMASVNLRDAGKTCCTVPPFTVSCASVPSGSTVHIDAQLDGATFSVRSRKSSNGNSTGLVAADSPFSFDISPSNPVINVNFKTFDYAYKGTIVGLFYATGNVVIDVDVMQTNMNTIESCKARQILASVGPRVFFEETDCQTIGGMTFWQFCTLKNSAGDGRGGPGVWVAIKHNQTIYKLVMLTRRMTRSHALIEDLLIPGCSQALPEMYYVDVTIELDINPMINKYIVKLKAAGEIREGSDNGYVLAEDETIFTFSQ